MTFLKRYREKIEIKIYDHDIVLNDHCAPIVIYYYYYSMRSENRRYK
jgi:hypothetical protein